MNYTKSAIASFGSLVLVVLLCGCEVDPGGSDDGKTSSVVAVCTDAPQLYTGDRDDYLAAINSARASDQDCGTKGVKPAVPPLGWSNKLYSASYEHSCDMAKNNHFSHTGSGTPTDITSQDMKSGKGSTMRERIEHSGYEWRLIAENIAAGTNVDTPTEVVRQWLKSDGHCANLMSPDFTEVGMAMVEDGNSDLIHYWTQDFASPR